MQQSEKASQLKRLRMGRYARIKPKSENVNDQEGYDNERSKIQTEERKTEIEKCVKNGDEKSIVSDFELESTIKQRALHNHYFSIKLLYKDLSKSYRNITITRIKKVIKSLIKQQILNKDCLKNNNFALTKKGQKMFLQEVCPWLPSFSCRDVMPVCINGNSKLGYFSTEIDQILKSCAEYFGYFCSFHKYKGKEVATRLQFGDEIINCDAIFAFYNNSKLKVYTTILVDINTSQAYLKTFKYQGVKKVVSTIQSNEISPSSREKLQALFSLPEIEVIDVSPTIFTLDGQQEYKLVLMESMEEQVDIFSNQVSIEEISRWGVSH